MTIIFSERLLVGELEVMTLRRTIRFMRSVTAYFDLQLQVLVIDCALDDSEDSLYVPGGERRSRTIATVEGGVPAATRKAIEVADRFHTAAIELLEQADRECNPEVWAERDRARADAESTAALAEGQEVAVANPNVRRLMAAFDVLLDYEHEIKTADGYDDSYSGVVDALRNLIDAAEDRRNARDEKKRKARS